MGDDCGNDRIARRPSCRLLFQLVSYLVMIGPRWGTDRCVADAMRVAINQDRSDAIAAMPTTRNLQIMVCARFLVVYGVPETREILVFFLSKKHPPKITTRARIWYISVLSAPVVSFSPFPAKTQWWRLVGGNRRRRRCGACYSMLGRSRFVKC